MIVTITVTGKDRPGIISALSETLYRAGGNLEDASMTILEGEFAMIFLAQLRTESFFTDLSHRLARLAKMMNLEIAVRKVKRRLIRGEKHRPNTAPWVI